MQTRLPRLSTTSTFGTNPVHDRLGWDDWPAFRPNPSRADQRIIIANTWCLSVSRDAHFVMFSFMISSWLGRYLIKRFNFFVNRFVPMAVDSKDVLTPQVMEHYRKALPTPDAQSACAALPGAIVGASDWLGFIWDDRRAFSDLPAFVLWGMKDIAFRRKELERWRSELTNPEVHEFPDCGHFPGRRGPRPATAATSVFHDSDLALANTCVELGRTHSPPSCRI